MRISDWSSDVCSSDLAGLRRAVAAARGSGRPQPRHPAQDRRPRPRADPPPDRLIVKKISRGGKNRFTGFIKATRRSPTVGVMRRNAPPRPPPPEPLWQASPVLPGGASPFVRAFRPAPKEAKSEERRVGKGGGRT